ncbi:hypothetical protein UA08_08285 [Talaromyces atroroseus]|uniref:Diphthine--ammonia ligase n=1 Tax=Talaromyces atroroseus TaxID=1441469 RepID=A0A225AQ38_TALAT|nr:hypothetical protein UA08_08285 [Talaromyces atroroseus]OKL56545.1 hypothetical protein UA08_08285 [Talaromyces atroroseus]
MPPSPTDKGLNVIALISGGKDSLYSILHCIRNGHRVVALANLHPPVNHQDGTEEDMDSFMYQTIGHNVIPLYESALGVPLYRASITGGAVDTSRIYRDENTTTDDHDERSENQDETESLVPLLNRIKRDIPHADAISAGAILSTYQRTRIENVAGRLGLVPLAFLWMYPYLPTTSNNNGGLLDDMAAAGCDSRIIKVASGGLDADILWENVASSNGSVQRRIEKAMKRFVDAEDLKGAVLGEGGEYETLALDGPRFLWKQRIVIEEADRQVHAAGSGVNFVRVLKARCVPKEDDDEDQKALMPQDIRRPSRLDERFRRALDRLQEQQEQVYHRATSVGNKSSSSGVGIDICETSIGGLYTISNVTAPEAGPTADAQMRGISEKLQALLQNSVLLSNETAPRRKTTSDIVFATVLLRSMQDFGPMNAIYVSLFTKPNPPARVTVACGDCLPDGVQVMISVVVDLGERSCRQGLHVQSRSYWAPANIGPYSQAITVPYSINRKGESMTELGDAGDGGLVYIAGQIPLDPPSMELPGGIDKTEVNWFQNFSLHATLSLQHLWRIGLAMQVDWWLGAIVFLARDAQRGHQKARIAHRLWQALHERDQVKEDDDEADSVIDVWDIKHGLQEDPRLAQGGRPLPNFEMLVAGSSDNNNNNNNNNSSSSSSSSNNTLPPPWFAVEVEELPRNSDIEWQALGATGMAVGAPVFVPCTDRETKIWRTQLNGALFYTIEMATGTVSLEDRVDTVVSDLVSSSETQHRTIYTSCRLSMAHWKGQVVPCHTVWGSEGDIIAAAVTVQVSAQT